MGKGQLKSELMQKRKQNAKKFKRPVGRPRVYNPQDIMQEMLEWVKNEDAINFAQFCADRGYLPGLIWRLEKENEEFENAYTLVRLKLAERRERFLNADLLNYGAYQRYQAGYDPFLYRHEDELAEKEAARKKGIADSQQMNLVMLAKLSAEGKLCQPE